MGELTESIKIFRFWSCIYFFFSKVIQIWATLKLLKYGHFKSIVSPEYGFLFVWAVILLIGKERIKRYGGKKRIFISRIWNLDWRSGTVQLNFMHLPNKSDQSFVLKLSCYQCSNRNVTFFEIKLNTTEIEVNENFISILQMKFKIKESFCFREATIFVLMFNVQAEKNYLFSFTQVIFSAVKKFVIKGDIISNIFRFIFGIKKCLPACNYSYWSLYNWNVR